MSQENNFEFKNAIGALKDEYKQKLKTFCDELKINLQNDAYDLLGAEYKESIEKRRNCADEYRSLLKNVFESASFMGYGTLVSQISQFVPPEGMSESEKSHTIDELMNNILTIVEPSSPELVTSVRECRNMVNTYNEQVGRIIFEHATDLSALEERTKSRIKEEIRQFVRSFAIDVLNLKEKYNIDGALTEDESSPFTDEEQDGSAFIPLKGSDGTMN